MNLQFSLLKEKRVGILVYILSATMQDNKRQEKNTYRASLIYLCHAYFKHADWYICQSLILWSFCCLLGNTTGLTQANRYQTSVPQPCNKPAWVNWWTSLLQTTFLHQKKETPLTEIKFKQRQNMFVTVVVQQASPSYTVFTPPFSVFGPKR